MRRLVSILIGLMLLSGVVFNPGTASAIETPFKCSIGSTRPGDPGWHEATIYAGPMVEIDTETRVKCTFYLDDLGESGKSVTLTSNTGPVILVEGINVYYRLPLSDTDSQTETDVPFATPGWVYSWNLNSRGHGLYICTDTYGATTGSHTNHGCYYHGQLD